VLDTPDGASQVMLLAALANNSNLPAAGGDGATDCEGRVSVPLPVVLLMTILIAVTAELVSHVYVVMCEYTSGHRDIDCYVV
jgi:hypothetical protein